MLLGCLPDVVDNAAQMMLQALVVTGLDAEETGLRVARDRTKRVVDAAPRKADPHLAQRDRQSRRGRAPIDERGRLVRVE